MTVVRAPLMTMRPMRWTS